MKNERTIMYSVRQDLEHEGEVVVHKFPWDRNDPFGMKKLQQFLDRGFTFEDPRGKRTKPTDLLTPFEETNLVPAEPLSGMAEAAPLYVSDKEPKPRKSRGKRS